LKVDIIKKKTDDEVNSKGDYRNTCMDIIEVDPSKPVLQIGGNIIWDLSSIQDPGVVDALFSSNELLKPEKIDENHISFCKCIFDVKALIYEKATSDDILSGWTVARNGLKLDRLVNVSLCDSLYNLHLTRYFKEPDIILTLRLVYWYYRCHLLQSNDTFKHKISEIKKKLTMGLLKQREKISKQVDIDANLNTFLVRWEGIVLRFRNEALDQQLLQTLEKYRTTWFKAVWNVTSELLFAALCAENGFIVTFAPSSSDHDYDFLISEYPVQIKTQNVSFSLVSAVDMMRQRKQLVDRGEITYEYVIQKVLEAIRYNFSEVEDALEQGAKIIFTNGTTDEFCGSYLSQLSMEEPDRFTLRKSLQLSINLAKRNRSSVPLIYCATAFMSVYYINSLAFKIPVTDQKTVDKDKVIEVLLEEESQGNNINHHS